MTTYITVTDPSALTPIAFTMDDVPKLGRGQEANIGTDMSAPQQLNCRYDGGLTYVQPIGGDVMPWKFEGYVSPEDCRAWYRSSVEPKAEAPKVTQVAKDQNGDGTVDITAAA